ncbi:MAG: hypothetical protein OEW29_18685 [Acidimicrobiia bacterium]|nr:hypothetical protein [Acidimicrobiia bacterium]MDH4366467.1 hypothetical protein [Acidimicrobiia bacterium]
MNSGKSQSKTIPKVVAWGAVALMMVGAWRYTNIFGPHDNDTDPTPKTAKFSYCERRRTLGESKFLEELTAFREEQQARGRLSSNDENAGVTLMIEVQHNFKVNCPEFTLNKRP